MGVLEQVPLNTGETWCSRMHITRKHNGEPRRVVDFQELNKASLRQTHPTEPPFKQASTIPEGSWKTVTDASNGYHSVTIKPTDRHFTTFMTKWGRYRYRSLPQGWKAAGDAYTHRFDKVTAGFPGVKRQVDDSLLYARSIQESFNQTCAYLTLLGQNGITQNKDRFKFCSQEVEWAGLKIKSDSIEPLSEHTEAIRTFPSPQNVTDLRSFVALVNQVANYFAVAPRLHPIRELLKKGSKWYWDEILEGLFVEMKEVIAREVEKGVRLFDPSHPTAIISDWSKNGVGYIMMQKKCSCPSEDIMCCKTGWQACKIGSRFTTTAESHYAPTEGELLAVQYGLHKTKHYTLGCDNLTVGTDHKPLLGILNDKSLVDIDNPRIGRLKEKTLPWIFRVIHVPGNLNGGPDCLSRRGGQQVNAITEEDQDSFKVKQVRVNIWERMPKDPPHNIQETTNEEGWVIAAAHPDAKPVTWQEVNKESAIDSDISKLVRHLENGEFIDTNSMSQEMARLWRMRSQFTVNGSTLIYKERPVIPKILRSKVLNTLHAAHQGVTKMTMRAEDAVFWPGISQDIITTRQRCRSCDSYSPSQRMTPPVTPVVPVYPFQHISADHLDFEGNSYGIIVDRFSNWLKLYEGKGGAAKFVQVIRSLISDFNIPETCTTDGGPQYIANITKEFFDQYGIQHRLCSVANPHANTRAELAVKTAKRLLRENVDRTGSLNTVAMSRALLTYRNTPDADTGLSPAELLLGRKLKDFLPSIPVDPLKNSKNLADGWKRTAEYRELALAERASKEQERWSQKTKTLPELEIGDRVAVQNQVGNHPKRWDRRGVVVNKLPFQQYEVRLDGSRRITLRNRRFLKRYSALLQDGAASKPSMKVKPPTLIPERPYRSPQEKDFPASEPNPHTPANPVQRQQLQQQPDYNNQPHYQFNYDPMTPYRGENTGIHSQQPLIHTGDSAQGPHTGDNSHDQFRSYNHGQPSGNYSKEDYHTADDSLELSPNRNPVSLKNELRRLAPHNNLGFNELADERGVEDFGRIRPRGRDGVVLKKLPRQDDLQEDLAGEGA